MPTVKERRDKSVSRSASGSNEDNIPFSFRFGNSNILSNDQSVTIVENNK